MGVFEFCDICGCLPGSVCLSKFSIDPQTLVALYPVDPKYYMIMLRSTGPLLSLGSEEHTALSDHPYNLVSPAIPMKAQATHDSEEWSLATRR